MATARYLFTQQLLERFNGLLLVLESGSGLRGAVPAVAAGTRFGLYRVFYERNAAKDAIVSDRARRIELHTSSIELTSRNSRNLKFYY